MSEIEARTGVVVVTHGRLGQELVDAARIILGREEAGEGLRALSVGWNDPVEEAREQVRGAVEEADEGAGVLVLTDMFGGTPTNISLSFLEEGRVEIVTGVNLPMVVKCLNLDAERLRGLSLRELAGRVAEKGAASVVLASSMLEP